MPLDIQTIFMIIFFLGMLIFVYKKRKNVEIQKILYPAIYFVLYRTKLGIVFMDRVAKKYKRFVKYIGYLGIFIGFLGMILLTVLVVNNFVKMLITPEALPGVGLVLPIPVKGVIFVPFFYWIISIFVIALVHEFSHGIVARLYNIKIKSSGFAFLGILIPIIPAAFVEPDEKQLVKRPKKEQLSVFAAGPLANILLGYIFLGLVVGISPISEKLVMFDGLEISGFPTTELFPAEKAGITEGEIINKIDNTETLLVFNFTQVLRDKIPGDVIKVTTDRNEYEITLTENPENKSQGYLGVLVTQHQRIDENVIKRFGSFLPNSFLWVFGLLIWLVILNIGIGLFNLAPVGPLDGGRMLHLVLISIFKKKKTAERIWKIVSILLLIMILVIILHGFWS